VSVEAALAAAHRLQPVLNADIAILDNAHRVAGGPLAGFTVALKDMIDQKGQVTTCGSAFYRSTPDRSAPVVERLEKAGAVIVGRNNLHEFAFGFSSENDWFGPVRNPWDLETSPGGSSGGTAVSVAAGIARVGIGTDTGGSIRVPAALCGVMGLKVTHGRVSLDGVFPLASSLDTVGPLARNVSDLATVYRVISGDDFKEGPAGTLRLGVPQPWVANAPASEEMPAAFGEALARLSGMGHEIVEVNTPLLIPPGMIVEVFSPEMLTVHGDWYREGRQYGWELIPRIEVALGMRPEVAAQAREWRQTITQAFDETLETVDLLATPAVPNSRKVIGAELIDGVHYRNVVSWFTALVNHTGCPAIALPLLTEGSPPPSLQLIAPRGREDLLLNTGLALEETGLVGYRPPPVNALDA